MSSPAYHEWIAIVQPAIFSGPLLGQGPTVFAVWMYAIAHARPDEESRVMVEMDPTKIAAIVGTDEYDVRHALKVLCQEDYENPNGPAGGRYLFQRSEMHYEIMVHRSFDYTSAHVSDEKREALRQAVRRWREKRQQGIGKNKKTAPRYVDAVIEHELSGRLNIVEQLALMEEVPNKNLGRGTGAMCTFAEYMEELERRGEPFYRGWPPLYQFAASIGLTEDMINLHARYFRNRYLYGEPHRRKKYIDWRAVFLRTIKENWFRLWHFDEEGTVRLTERGRLADMDPDNA